MFVNIDKVSNNVYKKCARKRIHEIYLYTTDDYKNLCLLHNLLQNMDQYVYDIETVNFFEMLNINKDLLFQPLL